jgi:hypothetical protein
LTKIFSLGNRRGNKLAGTALPAALALIFAVSAAIGAWYSLAWAHYVNAKKLIADYYSELDAHNVSVANEMAHDGRF